MPQPRPSRSLIAALPALLTVALVGYAVWVFATQWDRIMTPGARPPIAWGWVLVSLLLLVAHAAISMVLWRQLLGAVGSQLTWRQAIDSFAPSLLARYVPGKVWANGVRLGLARRAGVRLGASAGAMIWETLIALGSAALTACVASLALGGTADLTIPVVLLGAVIAIWGSTALVARHPRGAALLHRFGGTEPVRSPAALAPAVGTAMLGWLVYTAAHVALARSVAPVPIGAYPEIAAGVALAWAGGYLAIIMPVGLGVRDALLLTYLAPLLARPEALLFVALSRLVQLAVDASITLGWLLRQATHRTATAHPPSV